MSVEVSPVDLLKRINQLEIKVGAHEYRIVQLLRQVAALMSLVKQNSKYADYLDEQLREAEARDLEQH